MDYKGSLSVSEVAKFMGKSEIFVRKSIENGSLPIGSYDREGKRANYYISPKRAAEWLGYVRDEKADDNAVEHYFDGDQCFRMQSC